MDLRVSACVLLAFELIRQTHLLQNPFDMCCLYALTELAVHGLVQLIKHIFTSHELLCLPFDLRFPDAWAQAAQSVCDITAESCFQRAVPCCSLYTRHGRKLKSQVRHNTTSPVWDESFRFLVHVPGQQYLNGELKDWDRLSASDEIGRYEKQ